jgi:signal peptidase I
LLIYALVVPLASLIAIVVLTGLAIRAVGLHAFSAASSSMAPTLVVGDNLFVDRRAYADGRLPQRGDVIAHHVPSEASGFPAAGRGPVYIKRVIGLPGDRIELRRGVPLVNGTPVVRERAGDYPGRFGATVDRLRERPAPDVSYEVLQTRDRGYSRDVGPFDVPPGTVFVLGDNRDDSLDSRTWNGNRGWSVPLSDIIGQARYIYWSGFERIGRMGLAVK